MANMYKHFIKIRPSTMEKLEAIQDDFNGGKFVANGEGLEMADGKFVLATEIPNVDQMESVDVQVKEYLEITYVTNGFSNKVPNYLARHMELGETLEDCYLDYEVIDLQEMNDIFECEGDLNLIRKQIPDPTEEQLEQFNEIQIQLHGAEYFGRNDRWADYQRCLAQASSLMRQDFGHLLHPTETTNIESINLENGRIH